MIHVFKMQTGGRVIASGTPLEVAQNCEKTQSYTGKFLALELK
ncbi:hypothetical protein [Helicobacter pylori]|nr:hypothetical protein [Helicobacter pylori]